MLQADEVLIRVKRIGVCGSDIHVYHGLHPYTKYPVIQGHEVSGVIAETGPSVTALPSGIICRPIKPSKPHTATR